MLARLCPPAAPRRGRLAVLDAALAAVALAYGVVVVARAPRWTVDDAWIVARYAENLAHHGRLAWNLDGAPVEGFTSLASVLAAALFAKLGVAPESALAAFGVAGLLVSVPLVHLLARELRAAPPAGGIACILHVSMGEHVAHARSGLETELAIAAGLACAWLLARALRSPRAPVLPLALAGFAATTVRPEGAALGVIALGVVVASRRGAARWTALRAALGGFVAPLAALEALRVAWFGALVPNTFHAKRAGWNLAHARDLLALVDAHVVDVAIASAALVVMALGVASPRAVHAPSPRQRQVALAGALVVSAHVLVYARSVPLMDFARRFAMHATPWLVVAVLLVTSAGARAVVRATRLAGRNPARAAAAWALLGAACAFVVARSSAEGARERRRVEIYARSLRELYEPVVAFVRARTEEDATIAVYPDAGLIPYRTRRRAVDFGRLNDAFLARRAPDPGDVAAYFFSVRPAVLVVSEPRPGVLWDDGAEAIVHHPSFAADYALEARVESGEVALRVFARR